MTDPLPIRSNVGKRVWMARLVGENARTGKRVHIACASHDDVEWYEEFFAREFPEIHVSYSWIGQKARGVRMTDPPEIDTWDL